MATPLHAVNACLGARKADPLLQSQYAAFPVPGAFVITRLGDYPSRGATPSSPSLEQFHRTWNRLLGAGPHVHGLLSDRALLGVADPAHSDDDDDDANNEDASHAVPEPLLARNPRRVPVGLLRRFLFSSGNATRGHPKVMTYAHMTDEAVQCLNRANPFTREDVFSGTLRCRSADDVAALMDTCFTTFERSVFLLMRNGAEGFRKHVAPLVRTVRRVPSWMGVPIPAPALPAAETMDDGAYAEQLLAARLALWAVMVWRYMAAEFIERALDLHPYDDGVATQLHRHDAELAYQLHLFRETHLDVLTHMVHSGRYSDQSFVDRALREQIYPHALRVLCADELPDLSAVLPLTNIWVDTGARKSRDSPLQAAAHVLMCKAMNQKCAMRELPKLLFDYSDAFPSINRLFRLLLHCALLGNMPHAQARPYLAARLRINATFLFEEGGPSRPLRKSAIGAWMLKYEYVLLFLMREMLLYAVERDDVLNAIMNNNHRWLQYKRIVRTCNGDMRRVLSFQAARHPSQPFDWSRMQRDTLNRNGRLKKTGLVINYHSAGLKATTKLRKASWEIIVINEMTYCNGERVHGKDIKFDEVACVAALERMTDALCLTAWHASYAIDASAILPTKWLQIFLTPEGFARVRRMQFNYYIYDTSDHGFVDEIFELYKHCPMDYLYLRAYLMLVIHFRTHRCFFLPANYAVRQMTALRARTGIEKWFDTPPLLGKCLLCDRCGRWATPCIVPPFTSEKKSAIVTAAVAAAEAAAAVDEEEEEEEEEEDDDEEQFDEEDEEEDDEDDDDDDEEAVGMILDEIKDDERTRRKTKRAKRRVEQSSYESLSWFDPTTGLLYCRRKHRTNPLEALYATIPEIENDDEDDDDDDDDADDNEDDDDDVDDTGAKKRKPKAKNNKKKKKKKTTTSKRPAGAPGSTTLSAAPAATAAAAAAAGDDEREVEGIEHEQALALINSLMRTRSVRNIGSLESYMLKYAQTSASEERADEKAAAPAPTATETAAAVAAAVPEARRAVRKLDPVDIFLMHYFERANGGQLKPIDMVGVWFSTKYGVYGLCDVDNCGMLTRITNANITNGGVNCLHHITSNMRLDDPVRRVLEERDKRHQRNRRHLHHQHRQQLMTLSARQAPPAPAVSRWLQMSSRVPGKHIEPVRDARGAIVPCFYCKVADAEHTILVCDRSVRFCRIPLCTFDHNRVVRHLPRHTIPSGQEVIDALAIHSAALTAH
jgi:hypothetical protein